MRGGIYWRGSNRGRPRQQECNSNQSFVLRSGRQGCGRGASVLVGCLILCSVSWILSRFRTPSPISTESLLNRAPARAIVFELYRDYRHPQGGNRSLTGRIHRRRRGLQKDSETTASTPQEIFSEEEQEERQLFDGEGFGDDPSLEFDSVRKRKRCNNDDNCAVSMQCDQGASSPTCAVIKEWPIGGGYRKNHLRIESIYTKISLGNPGTERMRDHIMIIDTGSGQSWVNCLGSPVVGPAGVFKPRADSYLNCETSPDVCNGFQENGDAENYPCDRTHMFRCSYMYEYGDDDVSGGSVINASLNLHMSDGSKARHTVNIGCSSKRVDRDADGRNSASDGLLGVGPHNAGMLNQLYSLDLLSEYVLAICLEPARVRRYPSPRGGRFPTNHIGFLSLGDLYTSQAASTVWTEAIIPDHKYVLYSQATLAICTHDMGELKQLTCKLMSHMHRFIEAMYIARLVSVEYRDTIIKYNKSKKRKKDSNGNDIIEEAGVPMGFDTGSDLTWLGSTLYDNVVKHLEIDAKRLGFSQCLDVKTRRRCWFDPKDARKSLVQDFGNLIMQFSSLEDDATTSDLVIKPEYFFTTDVQAEVGTTCFNMLKDKSYPYGNIGAEAMRGHLFLFDQSRLKRIGWSRVASCKDLR